MSISHRYTKELAWGIYSDKQSHLAEAHDTSREMGLKRKVRIRLIKALKCHAKMTRLDPVVNEDPLRSFQRKRVT